MKRISALVMALLFVLTLVPVTARAAGEFVVSGPTKTTYQVGDTLDLAGLIVKMDGTVIYDYTGGVKDLVKVTRDDGDTLTDPLTKDVKLKLSSETYPELNQSVSIKVKDTWWTTTVTTTPQDVKYNEALKPSAAGISVVKTVKKWDKATNSVVSETPITITYGSEPEGYEYEFLPVTFTKDQIGQTVPITIRLLEKGKVVVERSDLLAVNVKGVEVDSVEVAPDSVEILPGKSAAVSLTLKDSSSNILDPNAIEDAVVWATDDASVADVSGGNSGATISVPADATAGSTAEITATIGSKSAKVKVTVADAEPTSLKILSGGAYISELTVLQGTEHKLTAVLYNSSGDVVATSPIVWEIDGTNANSDGRQIIELTEDGTIIALYPHDSAVKVKATLTYGGTDYSATVSVTVNEATTVAPDPEEGKKYTFLKIEAVGKKYYMIGEKYDPKDLEVRAYVLNESTGETLGYVISDFTYTLSHTKNSSAKLKPTDLASAFNASGEAKLTASYTFKYLHSDGSMTTKTLTASETLYVYSERPYMVVIDEYPYMTTYYKGETLDPDGLVLKVAYTSDGFDESSPKISRYEPLAINTETIPELNHKFTQDDVDAGGREFKIIGPTDKYGTAPDPATLPIQVSAPVTNGSDPADWPPVVSVSTLTFTYEEYIASPVTKKQFKVTMKDKNTPQSSLAWSISNPKTASYKVLSYIDGVFTIEVTPLMPGKTVISVRPRGLSDKKGTDDDAWMTGDDWDAYTGKCEIEVLGSPDEKIYAMKLDHESLTLLLGESGALLPVFTPETAYDDVTWEAYAYDDDHTAGDVAKAFAKEFIDVDKLHKEGIIKTLKMTPTVKNFKLYIEATTVNKHPKGESGAKKLKDDAIVYIVGIAVDSMTIDRSDLTLYAGSSEPVTAVVYPDEASDKTVAWASSDETSPVQYNSTTIAAAPIVEISSVYHEGSKSTGMVKTNRANFEAYCAEKGVDTYTATIYAVASSGITKSFKVTVRKSTLIDTITLDKHSLVMSGGETYQLTATIKPSIATNKELEWYSDNTTVATVDEAGFVTAKNPGVANIHCRAKDGSGSFDICVVQIATVLIQSITVDPYTMTINEGDTAQLTARLYPANVSSTKVTWSSSNTDVATVDANGKVTGQGGGEVIIRATSADGGSVYGTAIVKVRAAVNVTSVKINPGSFELLLNDSTTLSVSASPKGAEEMSRTWSTSDKSVVSVDANGKVSGLKLGSANITVKVGKKTDTITIYVVSALSRYGEVINCKKRVNVREGASGTSKTIGYAYLGDDYKVLGQTGNWVKIQYTSKKAGYIWYTYIDIVGGNQYVSNGMNTNAGTATSTNATYTQVTIVNVKEWCNVRSGPGTGFSKVGTAPLHSVYSFRGVQGDWIQVLYGNTTAYIYKDYCQLS
ncbi:MAG: Ig-like domain-containing protein [Clostridiales bacterium]|nr:Ig-like domain-containing protein [Clostridiales bacterium]